MGLEFVETKDGMIVHQHKFITDLLEYYLPHDAKITHSPLPSKLKDLYVKSDQLKDPTSYRQLVGKLNFLLHTRPDLSFTAQFLSQFNSNPGQKHFDAAIHVLKYLKGTLYQGVFLNDKSDFKLEAFCDSDWAGCPTTRKSVSGFFYHNGRKSNFVEIKETSYCLFVFSRS